MRQAVGELLQVGKVDGRDEDRFYVVPAFPVLIQNEEERAIQGVFNPIQSSSGGPLFYLEPLLGADINTGMAYVNHPEAVFLQTEIDGLYTFEIEVSGNFFIQRSIANIGKYSSLEWRFVMVVLNVAPPDAVVPGEITARVIPIRRAGVWIL